MQFRSLVLVSLLVTACSDSPSSALDAGLDDPDGGPGDGVLSGTVIDLIYSETTVPGVLFTERDSGATATSAADGTFSFTLPVGLHEILLTKDGFWDYLDIYDVRAEGTMVMPRMASDDDIETLELLLGEGVNFDESKGAILIGFLEPRPGVTVTLDTASDGNLTSGAGLPEPGNVTLEDTNAVAFYGIELGSTKVLLSDPACHTDVAVDRIPILPRTLSRAVIVCDN
jgi:hypothetical protein